MATLAGAAKQAGPRSAPRDHALCAGEQLGGATAPEYNTVHVNMYSLTIVLEPLAGKRDELVAACLATVEPTRAEPGCLFFDVLVGETEVVFYEAYRDEAAFQAHMAAAHTKQWQAVALPVILRSKIRFPAHRGVAPAPR